MRPLVFGPTAASSPSMRPLRITTLSGTDVAKNARHTTIAPTMTSSTSSNPALRRGLGASPLAGAGAGLAPAFGRGEDGKAT